MARPVDHPPPIFGPPAVPQPFEPPPRRCETLRPGDRVLVVMGHRLAAAEAQRYADLLRECFPDVHFTVVDAQQVLVQHAEDDHRG